VWFSKAVPEQLHQDTHAHAQI